jgi:hypothetical protein
MTPFPIACIAFVAGIGASFLIGSLHAQTASSSAGVSSALVMQAAAQTSATVLPVTFILDTENRRVKACRAPAFSNNAGPVCSTWTSLSAGS